jgi:hypothetical protein
MAGLALGAAVVALFVADGGATGSTTTVAAAPRLADVVVTDLAETSTYDGTLGRTTGDPVIVRRAGTVTAVPEPGTVVGDGDVLVWIDNEPVVVLLGDLPAWRSMGEGSEGADVAQLEQALDRLGFDAEDELAVDDEFTARTGELFADLLVAGGGSDRETVGLGDVVFLPEPIRVDEVLVNVGDPINPGVPVVSISSDDVSITFGLPTTEQGVIGVGSVVEVEMPNGTDTTATVDSISTVATRGEPGTEATFEVTLTLDDPAVAAGIDEAPVEITIVTESVEGVTAVPVTALLALVEGGYAVELEDGRLVGVDPGFYADGMVEITSDELAAGDRVVVP